VGNAPPVGIALLVTARVTSGANLATELRQAGCPAQTIALLEAGSWRIYVPGAPPAVNAAFPRSLEVGTPFFVACRP
jgi:hypothetical protein